MLHFFPLTCPKCQGDLSAVAQAGMRISFIDQREVIKKILPVCVPDCERPRSGRRTPARAQAGRQRLDLWEESLRLGSGQAHAPPDTETVKKEIICDPSFFQLI